MTKKERVYETPENVREELQKEAHLSFIGFTVFDFGHIFLALVLIIFSLVVRQEGFEEEVGECIIELVFAGLLISFVDGLALKSSQDVTRFRRNYNYAFLCVSSSLMVPLAFYLVEALTKINEPQGLLLVLGFVLSLLAGICFLIGTFLRNQLFYWRILMAIGVMLLSAYVPLMIAGSWLTDELMALKIIDTIHYQLPLVPAILGMIRLFRSASKSVLY